jgi:N6-adenosine-specific RNA methylase IME4
MKNLIESGQKFSIIYSDPPWSFNNKNTGGSMTSGASSKYSVMNLKDICALPVDKITNKDCILFMWWVASMPKEAIQVAESWGFQIKTMTGFNWVKKTAKGLPYFGMGFYTRQGSENCLIAVKGKPKIQSHSVRSVLVSTIDHHSKKPPVIRDRIVELCGDKPRIELFARNRVDGWQCWGNEV